MQATVNNIGIKIEIRIEIGNKIDMIFVFVLIFYLVSGFNNT